MAVWNVALLTVREAARKRFVAALAVPALLILFLSLLLLLFRFNAGSGMESRLWLASQYPIRRSVVMALCLGAVRLFSILYAVYLSVGILPDDIETGSFATHISCGVPRQYFFLGRWLGLTAILATASTLWAFVVFVSLSLQSGEPLWPLLRICPFFAVYPILVCAAGQSLTTRLRRAPAMAITLGCCATAWMDGILNGLGEMYDSPILRKISECASLLMPQGSVAHWIARRVEDINFTEPALSFTPKSPELMRDWGMAHGVAHLDCMYLISYIVVALALGCLALKKRDV